MVKKVIKCKDIIKEGRHVSSRVWRLGRWTILSVLLTAAVVVFKLLFLLLKNFRLSVKQLNSFEDSKPNKFNLRAFERCSKRQHRLHCNRRRRKRASATFCERSAWIIRCALPSSRLHPLTDPITVYRYATYRFIYMYFIISHFVFQFSHFMHSPILLFYVFFSLAVWISTILINNSCNNICLFLHNWRWLLNSSGR